MHTVSILRLWRKLKHFCHWGGEDGEDGDAADDDDYDHVLLMKNEDDHALPGDDLLKVLFSGVSWQMRWRRDNPVHTRPGQKSSSDITKTLQHHHHYHTFSVWFLYQNGFVLLRDDEWYSFQGAPVENDNDPERVIHQILIILRKHLIFQN